MNFNIKTNLKVDIDRVQDKIYASLQKGESNARIYYVEFTTKGLTYQIPSDATAELILIKPDGKPITQRCIIENNKVKITFTEQMGAINGIALAQLYLFDANSESSDDVKILVSTQMKFRVNNGSADNSYIISSSEFQSLIDALSRVNKAIENALLAIDMIYSSNDDIRADEALRVIAESKRVETETIRAANESKRKAQELERIEADKLRSITTATAITNSQTATDNVNAASESAEKNIQKAESLYELIKDGDIGDLGDKIMNLKTDFEELEIGGRNLIVGASIPKIYLENSDGFGWVTNGSEGNLSIQNNCFRLSAENGWKSFRYKLDDALIGKKVTIQCDVMCDLESTTDSSSYLCLSNVNNTTGHTLTNILYNQERDKDWVHISQTVTLNESGYIGFTSILSKEQTGLRCVYLFKNLKIERGDKATDWSPAPEDIDNRYLAITGGTVTGNLKLLNGYWVHNAYAGAGSLGYIKIADIEVLTSNANAIISFSISQRGFEKNADLSIGFKNHSTPETNITTFTFLGGWPNSSFYICKSGTGIFELYVKKSSTYDHIGILDIGIPAYMKNKVNVSLTDAFVTDLPTGGIYASYYSGEPVATVVKEGLMSKQDKEKLDQLESTYIMKNIFLKKETDLNTLNTPGLYCANTTALAISMKNIPIEDITAFNLTVKQHAGCNQTLTEYSITDKFRMWTRNEYNGAWSEWKRIYHSGDMPKATSSNDGFMVSKDKSKLDGIATGANKTEIVNNLITTVAGKALDAAQGKMLSDRLNILFDDILIKYMSETTQGIYKNGLGLLILFGTVNTADLVQSSDMGGYKKVITFDELFVGRPVVMSSSNYTQGIGISSVASVSSQGFTMHSNVNSKGMTIDWVAIGLGK